MKAEDRALKKYPIKIEWVGNQWDGAPFDVNSEKRFYYQQGYEQAEKDLALTWEDISTLKEILDSVEQEFRKGLHEDKDYIGYCKEVLNRFNKLKER